MATLILIGIGFILNLVCFFIWRNSVTARSSFKKRAPVNLVVFILWVIFSFVPITGIILGLIVFSCQLVSILVDDLRFTGPEWMHKNIE